MKLVRVVAKAGYGHCLRVGSIARITEHDVEGIPRCLGLGSSRNYESLQWVYNSDIRKIKCTKKNLRAFAKQFR